MPLKLILLGGGLYLGLVFWNLPAMALVLGASASLLLFGFAVWVAQRGASEEK